eukprot:7485045-Pyramimonas_sp.AAC.1
MRHSWRTSLYPSRWVVTLVKLWLCKAIGWVSQTTNGPPDAQIKWRCRDVTICCMFGLACRWHYAPKV